MRNHSMECAFCSDGTKGINRKYGKKGSVSMVYVFFMSAIVIVALVFVFVKFWPVLFGNSQNDLNYCVNNLQSAFGTVNSMPYGSLITFGSGSNSPISCDGFKSICFIGSHDVSKLNKLNTFNQNLFDDVSAGDKSNVFLIGNDNTVYSLLQKVNQSFLIDKDDNGVNDVSQSPHSNQLWLCVNITSGFFRVRMRSEGNSIMVSPLSR
ncbi:MAG: hypothetical protein GWP09_02505 [Nitrospiraceae bacterium]|nr:hypothetical protein [Nitrospiraceae bacterium]